jgi:hypothetical protein
MEGSFEVEAIYTHEVFKVVRDEYVPNNPKPIHFFIFENGEKVCDEDLIRYYRVLDLNVYRKSQIK